jgi:hypothetical protein
MTNEFDEIRPFEAGEMKQAFEDMLVDRQFNVMVRGFAPWLPKVVRNSVLRMAFMGVKTPLDFQKRFMKPLVNYIIRKHTDGCTFDGGALRNAYNSSAFHDFKNERFTFVSNHRDIVLDSAFLDVMLIKEGYPTTVEIGIGDNLLIYPWIKRLVRMNKAFTVRRGLTPHEMLRSSQLMSRYIHYAITEKKENIWIAQREGRAKDSNDRTQESVLKMLAMGGDLKTLNIVPLTISYEYDPCDYLKAQEMQLRRDNPAFRKSRQDDLDNMRIGIFGYKGHVCYRAATPVNTWMDEIDPSLPRNERFAKLAQRMDHEIHVGYELYPSNYIAADLLEPQEAFKEHYTHEDFQRFEDYLGGQLAKISIKDKDEDFLRECILTMYANPLRNQLRASAESTYR